MSVVPADRGFSYPSATAERAERAVRCAPFTLKLYSTMGDRGASLRSMVGETGVKNGYTVAPLSELAIENQLIWLIKVGVLRREVDGQGITDSFRLTPLGRQLLRDRDTVPKATWGDRLANCASHWWR